MRIVDMFYLAERMDRDYKEETNMNDYTLISERELEVRGIGVTVRIAYTYDDIEPAGDFDFGDEEENLTYLSRFERGELLMLVVRVSAFIPGLGLEGSDYLGACHIRASHIEEDIMNIVEECGMIDTAVAEVLEDLKMAQRVQQAQLV